MNEQFAVRVDGVLYGEKEIKTLLLEKENLRKNLASQHLTIEANCQKILSLQSKINENRRKADVYEDFKSVIEEVMEEVIESKISRAVERGY